MGIPWQCYAIGFTVFTLVSIIALRATKKAVERTEDSKWDY